MCFIKAQSINENLKSIEMKTVSNIGCLNIEIQITILFIKAVWKIIDLLDIWNKLLKVK
jgi:hypothetical protein